HSETRTIGGGMVSSSQIRDSISLLLAGRIDLDAFEDWFVLNTWNIHLSGSASAEALTFAVEESLSEYSSEHISLVQFLQELNGLVHRDNLEVTHYDA